MALLPYPPTEDEAWASIRLTTPLTVGWHVYAIQKALNDAAGATLVADGYYGPASDAAVKSYQSRMGVTSDGIVGPTTKRLLTEACARRVDREQPELPDGYVRELSRAEGGDNPSAINPYDPSPTDKGTDCGIIQYRCKENTDGTYKQSDLQLAFSPYDAMLWAAARFSDAVNHYLTYGWTRNNRVRAQKCALLYHNWPVGANDIAFEGILSNADAPATWAYNSNGQPYIKFLDGQLVVTRRDWANFYAGIWQEKTSTHQGSMAKAINWGI
jgi:hypothetical protein